MDRFNGLRLLCWVVFAVGCIATIGGLLATIVFAGGGATRIALMGAVIMAMGIWTALISGAIDVLIAIYQNTCSKPE